MFRDIYLWFKFYFNIDKMGKGIASKIIYVLLTGIGVSIYFLPEEYSDFTALQSWFLQVMAEDNITEDMMVVPLTMQNWIFIGLAMLIIYVSIMLAILYGGLLMKGFRKEMLNDQNVISNGKFVFRYICFGILIAVIFIPMAFAFVYLLLLFVLAIPFMLTAVNNYMSGDMDIVDSIIYAPRSVRGKYLKMMRDLTGSYLIYIVLDLLVYLLSFVSPTAYMIVSVAFRSWYLLVIARIGAYDYLMTFKRPVINKLK